MALPSKLKWASTPGSWDPLHARHLFDEVTTYGVPTLTCVSPQVVPDGFTAWPQRRSRPRWNGVHFFVDDYRFESVWKRPDNYAGAMKRAPLILSPDFSVYADWPQAMQLWQIYRARWLCRQLHELGVSIVPSVTWGDRTTYAFAYLGLPTGATVAISTIGRARHSSDFDAGFCELVDRIRPQMVIAIGERRLPRDLERMASILYRQSDVMERLRPAQRRCSSADIHQ